MSEYRDRYEELKSRGVEVEVRGMCESACTLVTSVIPKGRLCFGANAALRFHKATELGKPSNYATQWMVDSYPVEIRGWIEGKGGVERMPVEGYWTLPAAVLWSLGFDRCRM